MFGAGMLDDLVVLVATIAGYWTFCIGESVVLPWD